MRRNVSCCPGGHSTVCLQVTQFVRISSLYLRTKFAGAVSWCEAMDGRMVNGGSIYQHLAHNSVLLLINSIAC